MSTIPTSTGRIILGTANADALQLPTGGLGLDTLFGVQGDDTLTAGIGSRGFIFGGRGNDSLAAGIGTTSGSVFFFGDQGDDTITGAGIGVEGLFANGGPGDDSIYGSIGRDFLYGGKDNDTIVGNDGQDVIFGDNGDDLIIGGRLTGPLDTAGNILYGNQGDDTIYGSAGNDSIFGGKDDDMINVDPALLGQAFVGVVQVGHVGGNNVIRGDQGNDTIGWRASTGNNIYDGGEGDDSLVGGIGGRATTANTDGTINTNVFTDRLTTTPPGGTTPLTSGNDSLYGGVGNDILRGSGGNNTLNGGAGNDSLYSGLDRDTLIGGEGTDRFAYERDVIRYNSSARDNLGAPITAQVTVANRITRADRITDFNAATTQGDLIQIQAFTAPAADGLPAVTVRNTFSGFDRNASGALIREISSTQLTGLPTVLPGATTEQFFGAGAATGDTGTAFEGNPFATPQQQILARQQLQNAVRGTVRAQQLTTADQITSFGLAAANADIIPGSIVIYIEQDFRLLAGPDNAQTALGTIGGLSTFTFSENTLFGLSAGDTVLAVLTPPSGAGVTQAQITQFTDQFVSRGAGNFAFV
ncbi:calcium-binding protein [Desertifilum sp. FACHB-1129]|uniref:Calcium-binding protein n=1 Tax=Desertifilum tharense IPPAS B-1220 TaxID=1781255 RepID=A0A1E5QEF9_9CYAN|nr:MULTISPECIES: calcium-binding protein [Desertifilum]MDA0211976.1 calcium-binding protein [Cyanobacteria bacterium FC1]MBD2313298.1 calcium-binding protein [Desertifilum sp. FACHB-1129]MBD2324241.1 calcium-binding protein [Desertifilum sp. FACHB-866]MBD2334255.1 calcium-binding protein [Desertifilum sp. FACHB-868]OEJ73055.1 hypothetical protein BH720_21105 [Desertifilum tharense IPPAS B-1220]